ncbi:Lcl C-terminal domain-containing protein [Spirochaeta dissipatitropha]
MIRFTRPTPIFLMVIFLLALTSCRSPIDSETSEDSFVVGGGGGGGGNSADSNGGESGDGNGGESGIVIPFPAANSGQITSYAEGDDADLAIGVELPSPRFTNNNDGTITDNATGLIWVRNMQIFGEQMQWKVGIDAIALLEDGEFGLNDGSQSGDWRMPNRNELRSLVDHSRSSPALSLGHPFQNATAFFWSSTTRPSATNTALQVNLWSGDIQSRNKTDVEMWVIAVRGESNMDYPVRIPRTGAGPIIGYELHPDEDGSIQAGVAWPDPRFIDLEDGTFLDLGTGLIWPKTTSLGTESNWADIFSIAADLQSGHHGLSDNSQAGDWRIPTLLEFETLIDFGTAAPYSTTGGITGSLSSLYWTSTIARRDQLTVNDDKARVYFFQSGQLYGQDRSGSTARNVWAVREASQSIIEENFN